MDQQSYTPIIEDASSAAVHPRQGLVTVFTGDGRGKTTAAIGTTLRAAGHGLRVLVVLFMKGPNFVHSETIALRAFANVTLQSFGAPGWAIPGRDNTVHQLKAAEALAFITGQIASQNYDLIVMDEVISAVHFGLLPEEAVVQLIKTKPLGLELIMTGRGATAKVIESADLVTEMKCIKHPFERGIAARAGVDY